MRKLTPPRLLMCAVLLGAVGVLLSGCELFSSPQNTFAPGGPVAEDQKRWFLWAVWPALAIMIGVFAAIVYILVRFRRKEGDPLPAQVHGNTAIEITWTVLPAVLLMFFVPVVIIGIVDFADIPDDAIEVDVNAQQWNWQFTYRDANGDPVEGPFGGEMGELHIPVGENIALRLHTVDVIHSFWVPKLAGKLDVIPGRTNSMWLRADETGTFSGQCAEFCGTGHANMRLVVIAETREEYDRYLSELVAARDGAAGSGAAVDAGER